MINLGEDGIKLMLGNAEVSKAYIGTEQVYPNEQPYEGFARLTYQNGDVYEIEGSGSLNQDMVRRGITDSNDPHYYRKVTKAEIGGLCTSIGNEAFKDCYDLTSVTIPNSVTSIGDKAFLRCSGLTLVTIPNSVTTIGDYAFYGCESLIFVFIPNSVTTIGSSAFYYCPSMTVVAIPNSVTSIGYGAFEDCSSLTAIICRRTSPPTLGASAFDSTNSCHIYVPAESVEAYKTASRWSSYASRVFPIP